MEGSVCLQCRKPWVHSHHHRPSTCLETCNSRGQGKGPQSARASSNASQVQSQLWLHETLLSPPQKKEEGVGGGKGQTAERLGSIAVYLLLEMQFVYERCRQVSLAVSAFQVCLLRRSIHSTLTTHLSKGEGGDQSRGLTEWVRTTFSKVDVEAHVCHPSATVVERRLLRG